MNTEQPTPRIGLRLYTRISLLLALVLAFAWLGAAALWLREARIGVAEEMESASRVAAQWLTVTVQQAGDDAAGQKRLVDAVRRIGRIRAHALEIVDARGARVYASPLPTYKAGRDAPAWFAALVTPHAPVSHYDAGPLQISLLPDPSRAVLDAWDNLVGLAGWGLAILLVSSLAIRQALRRALTPLMAIDDAFARGAEGRFDRHLPTVGSPELDRLADSYNRLADRLSLTLADHAALHADHRLALALQQRLDDDRQQIAQELHDELAQGITAVRSIAASIQQRSADRPGIHGGAQVIVALTGQMQDGVRAVLQRLRPASLGNGADCLGALRDWCARWETLHPGIALQVRLPEALPSVDDGVALTLLRLAQEALTNVARHAGARRASLSLRVAGEQLVLRIADDGCGFGEGVPTTPPGHFGLTGMQERAAAVGGRLQLARVYGGGACVLAELPCHHPAAAPVKAHSAA